MNEILKKIADNLLYIVIIVLSLFILTYGFVVILKFLSPILLPLTLVYIFSIVLSQPYRYFYIVFRKLFNRIGVRKFNTSISHFLSFGMIFIILGYVVYYVGKHFGTELSSQYVNLGTAIHDNWTTIKAQIENFPIYRDITEIFKIDLKSVTLKDEIEKIFSKEFINSAFSAFTKIKSLVTIIKDGAFQQLCK